MTSKRPPGYKRTVEDIDRDNKSIADAASGKEEEKSDLELWSAIIEKQGEQAREKLQQQAEAAKARALLLEDVPLALIISTKVEEACEAKGLLEILLEEIEVGKKGGGYSHVPSPEITALVRVAEYWYYRYCLLASEGCWFPTRTD